MFVSLVSKSQILDIEGREGHCVCISCIKLEQVSVFRMRFARSFNEGLRGFDVIHQWPISFLPLMPVLRIPGEVRSVGPHTPSTYLQHSAKSAEQNT